MAQLVGIADDINRGDLLAVDRYAQGEIELAVQIEQGARGAVDRGGFDANVVLSPHIGGHTLESHVAMQDCVIANLDAFFAGQPLPYAVPLG